MASNPVNLEETLPRADYLDEDRFALERRAIFHAEWFCAGRLEGLDEKGDYRLADIAGERILLVRGDDAILRGFHNVCRHRGAELVPLEGPHSGRFAAGIRCPYHSWTYRLNGELYATPHFDVDKTCLGLHAAEVDAWGGYVFVRIAAGTQDLAEMLGPIPQRIRRYPLGDLRIGHRIDYRVRANWKVILENYNECYHCGGVHPELCKIVPAFRKGGGSGLAWDEGIPQREGTNTFTITGTTTRAAFPDLDEEEKVRHKGELIYPNLLLSLSMDHAASFTLWPRAAGITDIVCEFLFHPDEMARADFDASDAVEFWDLVNRQDWAICESVQRGMGSTAFQTGYYAPMEDLSLDIRDYVRRRLERLT